MDELPVVDLGGSEAAVASAIDDACRRMGFFYVVGHGIDVGLQESLEARSREFFAQADDAKAEIAMSKGGRAWRGWFPVGGELTSGIPDRKEGIYFGAELPPSDVPLHGPNLFPSSVPGLRDVVLDYLDAMTGLGHRLIAAVSLGLGLDVQALTTDPTNCSASSITRPSPSIGASASTPTTGC